MSARRLQAVFPYLITLAAAGVLWALTGAITYSERAGQIGPSFWPRVAIVVMAAAALIEIVRKLASPSLESEVSGIGDALEGAAGVAGEVGEQDDAPRVPLLLIGAMVLTLAYGVLVATLGFTLSTFLFLVLFTYLGRYRNHAVIWLGSALGTLVFAFVFLKLVYVSLPRGSAPFDRVTDAVLALFAWY